MFYELAEKDKNLINEIVKKYKLNLLLLFGSRVSGKSYKGSDFDVAYLSSQKLDIEGESRLITNLIPIFKSENIDLVNLKEAPPLLFFAIFQKPIVLYTKKPLLFSFLRAYAFKKYIETKPFYEEKFRRLKKQIKTIKA